MSTAPTICAIRVDGHLDDHWSAWLGELDMTRDEDGTTTLTVAIADQARLHGVLAGLRDIGAVITELRTTDAPIPTSPQIIQTDGTPAATQGCPSAASSRIGGSLGSDRRTCWQ